MEKKPTAVQRWWQRYQFAEAIITAWGRLPSWARAGVKWVLAPILALGVSTLTAMGILATGFVQDYWHVAILCLTSGVGAGTMLRAPIGGLTRSLDQAIGQRAPGMKSNDDFARDKARKLLPHMDNVYIAVLQQLCDDGTMRVARREQQRQSRALEIMKEQKIVRDVGFMGDDHDTVWELNPAVREVVAEFLAGL
jgi:hypothetical protein